MKMNLFWYKFLVHTHTLTLMDKVINQAEAISSWSGMNIRQQGLTAMKSAKGTLFDGTDLVQTIGIERGKIDGCLRFRRKIEDPLACPVFHDQFTSCLHERIS